MEGVTKLYNKMNGWSCIKLVRQIKKRQYKKIKKTMENNEKLIRKLKLLKIKKDLKIIF